MTPSARPGLTGTGLLFLAISEYALSTFTNFIRSLFSSWSRKLCICRNARLGHLEQAVLHVAQAVLALAFDLLVLVLRVLEVEAGVVSLRDTWDKFSKTERPCEPPGVSWCLSSMAASCIFLSSSTSAALSRSLTMRMCTKHNKFKPPSPSRGALARSLFHDSKPWKRLGHLRKQSVRLSTTSTHSSTKSIHGGENIVSEDPISRDGDRSFQTLSFIDSNESPNERCISHLANPNSH